MYSIDMVRRFATLVALFVPCVSALSAAENPFAVGEATSSDTVTWVQQDTNHWKLYGARLRPVEGEVGKAAGLVVGTKLITLAPDGTPDRKVIPLINDYAFVGLRPGYIVGVTKRPAVLEIRDRSTGKQLRRVELGDFEPMSLKLHPHAPVAYVSISRSKSLNDQLIVKGFFVAVDETLGKLKVSDDYLGQSLAVDPAGRFLVAGYSDVIPFGSELVRIPGVVVPGTMPYGPSGPMPGYPQPGYRQPGYPQPGYSQPGFQQITPDRMQVVTRSVKVSLAMVFDLDNPLRPEPFRIFEIGDFPLGLRLSFDGTGLNGFTSTSALAAYNPLNPKAETVKYDFHSGAEKGWALEFQPHPLAPLTAVAFKDQIIFYDAKTGARRSTGAIASPAETAVAERCVWFSPDGRSLLSAVRDVNGVSRLSRAPVPFSEPEIRALEERRARKPESSLAGQRIAPAQIEAFRGGLVASMRSAEITKQFSRAVVIVRSGGGTGTGFVVGSSGYILTCAHCVMRFADTTVVYQGDDGKEIEAKAVIVRRDPKLDAALLKITPKSPLPTVVLAPPIATSHGEEVTVISNPALGDKVLKNSITTGVVSNPDQEFEEESYIQSSAVVNPGSSGGPMFDQHGKVVGMVVLKAKIDGVGFAVPAKRLTEFLLTALDLKATEGRLVRSWADQSEKYEFQGAFITSDEKNLTVLDAGTKAPRTFATDVLSAGDRELLKLMKVEAGK